MDENFFRPGSYYFICDVCGEKHHKEKMKLRWDNMVVCPKDYETRHPQDFLRAREDRQSVPVSRPRPTDSYRLFDTFTDSVAIEDGNVDYIDSTYFLEDYIINPGIIITASYNRNILDSIIVVDSVTKAIGKPLSDSQSFTDSGTITLPLYIDATYFLEDYIATTQGF